jgi:uncharacterized protein (DUF934 family)
MPQHEQGPQLIKHGEVIEDSWQLLRSTDELTVDQLPAGQVIVPLAFWQANREALLARGNVAVWLASDQPPSEIAEDLARLPLVAIDFPLFTDGRGFSYGRALREQFDYKGEVRAIGQFIRDQLYHLSRCGFDAYALETSDPHAALGSLNDFSDAYQASMRQPLPRFRRRA